METTEIIEIINSEIPYCLASEENGIIVVVVRAKRNDRVFIKDGEVSYKGKCITVAGQIADRFNLVKNF